LAEVESLSFKSDRKLRGEIATLNTDNIQCSVFTPSSFMNVSGECVRAVCQFYKILPSEILVAHDDLDLPVGSIRLKTGGGHGGHNGLRDIISRLNTKDFNRLRIGIGHPGHRDLVVDYVLGKPSVHDRELIDNAINSAIDATPTIIEGNFAKAMQNMHL
jgi:peptidyl-tRNA hydrolase, PTH1 family